MLVLGTDVWADGPRRPHGAWSRSSASRSSPTAWVAASSRPATRCWSPRRGRWRSASADLVVVVGTPLDFRLGYGRFGGKDGAPTGAVVHCADATGPARGPCRAGRVGVAGDLTPLLDGIREALPRPRPTKPDWSTWTQRCGRVRDAVRRRRRAAARSDADPIHPARIYGELVPRLADDAVVIGDGGDFVSFAGKYVEPKRPGRLARPRSLRMPGHRARCCDRGADRPARRRRSCCCSATAPPGMSLMDVDTLVRHDLPVVMVVGNNSCWGLEKHPMRFLYGYDVAADLAPKTAYDEVVQALGGDGETVTQAGRHRRGAGPGLRRRRALPGQRAHRPRGRRIPRTTTGV